MEGGINKIHYLVSVLVLGGIVFSVTNFYNKPLFENLDNFVLFAQEEIKLEKEVQISSGDIGSNNKIDIEKDTIINGNLFADTITLDKGVTINGNASYNKLKLHKDAQILGTQTKPISLPIANLPEISDFTIGTQNFKFIGENNALNPGNYRDIVLEKDSRLVLLGGIYNLNKLELKENSTLIFNAPTTFNIQFKLKGQYKVVILPGQNLKPDDLTINYLGIRPKKEKDEKEDDDDEINSYFGDDKERKDYRDHKIGRPVVFGKESFLNFKLLAPKARVRIGEETTLRGQILAKKIKIEKGGILSREEVFAKESDPIKIVEEQGVKFIVNEIVILFKTGAVVNDLIIIADSVSGRITGFLPDLEMGKIEVQTQTIEELNNLINSIKNFNNPLVEDVLPNILIL